MVLQRFWTIFLFIELLCVATIIYTSLSFENIELVKVDTWTITYFAIPVFVFVSISIFYIYIKFYRHNTFGNGLFPISKEKLKTFFTFTYLSCLVSLIFILTAHSSIVLSNAYLGNNKTIKIEAEILQTRIGQFKGYNHTYIVFKDSNTNNIIELKVGKSYQAGQIFKANLLIGKWGIIYSRN